MADLFRERVNNSIQKSRLISRDLSWMQFNHRVLDQAISRHRTIFERLKFMAITASNLDEFFMVRVGSLYNYLDYNKSRLDYSGLRERDFRRKLLEDIHFFVKRQYQLILGELIPAFPANGFKISSFAELATREKQEVARYFKRTIFPILTPMVYDSFRTFPVLMNQLLIFCVVTKDEDTNTSEKKKLSFVQIPPNLPRFYEIEKEDGIIFVPIEEVIEAYIDKLFRNVEILSSDLIRITRNGDFTLEESEDLENDFIEEIKRKLKTRKTGRVVRLEVSSNPSEWMIEALKERFRIDPFNIFELEKFIDLTGLWQIVKHDNFKHSMPVTRQPITPLAIRGANPEDSIFDKIKSQDILLHHPYNSAEHLLELLETAAEDANVLAIKLTIYRLADDSRVTNALLKAAENGKHVSALFEVKARFDEENNIQEAKKLQKAGCFVIYGIGMLKTHTKVLLVVRKEGDRVSRYVHLSSGNYNEDTAKLYTDVSLMTAKTVYGQDVSEFFNAITGHSIPQKYEVLLTAPRDMRDELIALIDQEAENAKNGHESGICIKINSLQDDKFIEALYNASQAGVRIKLIVRGICSLKPNHGGLSENITVRSLVGDYLEHSRLFYFHNQGLPIVFGGSADAMARSFDRRIESLFQIMDPKCQMEAINILHFNLLDNVNAYEMQEDGSYTKISAKGQPLFNSQTAFFDITQQVVREVELFSPQELSRQPLPTDGPSAENSKEISKR